MAMRDSHRLFLQSFMSRGLLDAKEVRLLFKTVCLKFNEPTADREEDRKLQLLDFVRTINMKIRPFHMEIKKGVSEGEGASYYCLVCTNESAITRLASDYTQTELEFFKKLVDLIVENEGEIGSTAAVNIVDKLDKTMKKMTKQDAQILLQKLGATKWILIHKVNLDSLFNLLILLPRVLTFHTPQFFLSSLFDRNQFAKLLCNLELHFMICLENNTGKNLKFAVLLKYLEVNLSLFIDTGPVADIQNSQIPSTSSSSDAISRKRKGRP
ncbi:non-structural maintenance of chromosomes element 1 homolog [Argopecten irradians]|uniref:non-structural maintenance of chromosomes element 1 homolog n=1 Tax=Argopecten irradians TaxID=31199 RepID=UPI003713A7BE